MRLLFLGHQPEDPDDREREPRLRALVATYASPGTTIELAYPDDFPGGRAIRTANDQGRLGGLTHAVATGPLIQKVVWAEAEGYDAVVQSNHFDPGVEAARLAVRIPVIGLLRTALHVATMFADRVGVVVPLDAHVPYTRRLIRTYGMDGFVADVRALGQYGTNASLTARKADVFERTVATIQAMAREQRVEYIVPLGGALIPQVISAQDLERATGVPVTDNYGLGIRAAELAVAAGIRHSPITYPHTPVPLEDYGAPAYPRADPRPDGGR